MKDDKLLFMNLGRAGAMHRRLIEICLNNTGVYRSQHHMLMYLADHDSISQKELADGLEISPATVAVTVKKLCKGGYIEKIIDADDNRYYRIVLSAKGRDIIEESRETFRSIDREATKGLTEQQIQEVTDAVKIIQNNLLQYAEDKGIQLKMHCHAHDRDEQESNERE